MKRDNKAYKDTSLLSAVINAGGRDVAIRQSACLAVRRMSTNGESTAVPSLKLPP